MKRIALVVVLVFLFASFAHAGGCLMIGGSAAVSAPACDPENNEIGDRVDTYSDTNNIEDGYIKCELYVADCTGTANAAWLYRVELSDYDKCKIGLCDSADGATEHSPATHDANCMWAGTDDLLGDGSKWYNLGDIGKSVTNGNYYWRCVMGGGGDCRTKYKASAGTKKTYSASGFTFSNPPSNLNGTWTETAERNRSAYVEID